MEAFMNRNTAYFLAAEMCVEVWMRDGLRRCSEQFGKSKICTEQSFAKNVTC